MSDDTIGLSRSPTWIGFVGWIALSLAAGAVGGIASAGAPTFYAQLSRPEWAPPGWLFGPVWTTLYILMGVAAWLVWRERGWMPVRGALILFVTQLACNALWTWLFFAWRQGDLALAGIAVLLVLIVATMVAFARIRALAAVLLVPYFAWVVFAASLTAAVWQRNRDLL